MSLSEQLESLAALHQRGVLTDAEFTEAKARVLGQTQPGSAPATAATVDGLRRSRTERWLGGVCGGLGQATGVAAWLWRLAFVLFVLCAGAGALVYLLLWVLVPLGPARPEGHAMQAA